jgi:mono/diheme cytochrome c family protein
MLTLAGCGSAPRPASDRTVPVSTQALYEQRCGSCHQAYDPGSRTAARWDKALAAMQDRAGLDPQQVDSIRQWLHRGARI